MMMMMSQVGKWMVLGAHFPSPAEVTKILNTNTRLEVVAKGSSLDGQKLLPTVEVSSPEDERPIHSSVALIRSDKGSSYLLR